MKEDMKTLTQMMKPSIKIVLLKPNFKLSMTPLKKNFIYIYYSLKIL